MKENNLNQILSKAFSGWNYTSNHQPDEDGRIIVLWKDHVSITILQQSSQCLTCEVQITNLHKFIYTAVNASNQGQDRTHLWIKKIKVKVKRALKQLNRENFSQIQERVRVANNLLQVVQVQALQIPSPQLFQQERDLNMKWCFPRTTEENFFKHKSRINSLKEGDLNTTYLEEMKILISREKNTPQLLKQMPKLEDPEKFST